MCLCVCELVPFIAMLLMIFLYRISLTVKFALNLWKFHLLHSGFDCSETVQFSLFPGSLFFSQNEEPPPTQNEEPPPTQNEGSPPVQNEGSPDPGQVQNQDTGQGQTVDGPSGKWEFVDVAFLVGWYSQIPVSLNWMFWWFIEELVWRITTELIEAEWRIYASVNQPSLVQIMACRLVGVKPLSEPMLGYC